MRILFVCLGNICRSPAAEGVLRQLRPDWQIESAGLGAWHVGKPPYAPMQAEAERRGYDLSGQRARQVTPDDFDRFDQVLAMDRAVLRDLHAMPGGQGAQLFATVCGLDIADVPDPYYTDDFAGSLQMIEEGLRRMVADPPH